MRYHYLYCIENTANGKIYVGKHSTFDLNDGYMGSGKLLRQSINKYGIDCFQKHFLQFFETEEEAFLFEKEIVDEQFVLDENTYNLMVGGEGGWPINHNELLRKEKNHRAALAMNRIIWSDHGFRKRTQERASKQIKRLRAEGKVSVPDWTGRTHRQETKETIGKKNSISQAGHKNSQFGTVWIRNNAGENRKVSKDDLQAFLSAGWIRGRKMNNSQA